MIEMEIKESSRNCCFMILLCLSSVCMEHERVNATGTEQSFDRVKTPEEPTQMEGISLHREALEELGVKRGTKWKSLSRSTLH